MAFADDDYSGVYYLNSRGQDGKTAVSVFEYYLCPTEGWCYYVATNDYTGTDNGQPFITTYKCKQHANDVNPYDVRKAIWIIEKAPAPNSDYYYIKHALDGKYLVYNGTIRTSGDNRCRVHIESMVTPDNNALFTLLSKGENIVAFQPKNAGSPWVLTVNQGNYDYLYGTNAKTDGPTNYKNTGGIVGIWNNEDDINSPFYLEDAVQQPVISQAANGDVTITCATTSTTIYYTLDGSDPVVPADGAADPTSPTYNYTSTFPPALGSTGVKAVAVLSNLHAAVSKKAELSFSAYSTPTFSYNGIDQVTISASHADATIYYTTDGSTPVVDPSLIYGGTPLTISGSSTVKAIATHTGFLTSDIATFTIAQVATPTIQNNGSNAISITSDTPGATIYYTIDGSTPSTSSNLYTIPLRENVSGVTIKAIAVKENMITSDVGSGAVTLQCEAPVITRNGNSGFRVTCPFPASGVTIYYTTDGNTPTTSSSSTTSGGSVSCSLPVIVNAFAVATNYDNSTIATASFYEGLGGDGSVDDPYTIEYQSDVTSFITEVSTVGGSSKHYKVIATGSLDFSDVNITQDFSGTFDGGLCVLTGLTHALFNKVDGGTVKNVILKGVTISNGDTDGDAGAICNKAEGASVIYNCGILPTTTNRDDDGNITGFTGSTVSGSRYVGGLVGFLDGTSRVINCYSYANITGGSVKAGIVGYNNYASKYTDLKTMVMNCMFYGDISTTSGSVYPIYGGLEISNDYKANAGNRLNNYNYFLYEAPFSINNHTTSATITAYNCALAAEERFLVRFEFYRHLLNSNRELAAWYATGNAANGKGIGSENQMLKWVLDKSIAPYPILKVQDKYPSVVNYDEEYTFNSSGEKVTRASVNEPNKGGIVSTLGSSGSLTINIQMGSGGAIFDKPTDASITTASLSRPIIDKDFDQYNFNYGKVQLPYYNEVGTKNYTGNRVVTGWKIVSMTGGTSGGYTETDYDAPNYNYADRDHYGKDLYGTSGRIFAQGAYFNVPTGVTAITIEPYWARCAYLSNKYYDRYGYNTTDDLSQIGGSHYEAATPSITIDGSTQTVYTTLASARSSMGANYEDGSTVYDHAIVLVGNYHHHTNDAAGEGAELNDVTAKPLTITSVDLNEDNEPDYCLIFRSGKQKPVAPIRYDFITLPGMAMALKMATHTNLAIPGNCKPQGWFEVTTTGLIKFGQFEHSWADNKGNAKTTAPVIFMGGVIDQFVANNTAGSGNVSQPTYNNKTNYMLFGDNVWFLLLSNGTHADNKSPTPHRPISLVGGEYETLYLSGYFRPDANAWTTSTTGSSTGDNNAECYIDGGKFGEVAGAGQEKIDGNVTWIIDHADIDNFYGGGINSANPITGNISITIKNSRVDVFCGGPKFGNMASTKTVETEATGCTFRKYFGGGFGGTSIYRDRIQNQWESLNYISDVKGDWATWVRNSYDNSSGGSYRGKYAQDKGVAVNYEYEFFGGSKGNVARLYIDYASFSLAQTNGVTSTLTGCTIKENFYGGGSLGAVVGNVISTLTNCTVFGNVFGAGYSVDIPTVTVRNTGGWSDGSSDVVPYYNNSTAIYEEPIWQAEVTYTWDKQSVSDGGNALVADGLKIKTNDSLDDLAAVTGNVTLTLNGTTKVGYDEDGNPVDGGGNVYGGGEESAVKGAGNKVTVNLSGNTEVYGDVFGGGDEGVVEGSTEVNIGTNP